MDTGTVIRTITAYSLISTSRGSPQIYAGPEARTRLGTSRGLSRKLWSGPRAVSTDCEAIVLIAGRLLECEVNHFGRAHVARPVTIMEGTDLDNTP